MAFRIQDQRSPRRPMLNGAERYPGEIRAGLTPFRSRPAEPHEIEPGIDRASTSSVFASTEATHRASSRAGMTRRGICGGMDDV
ncbi:MAG TPA: hypothetical protein VH414_11710 [Lichenihabitans sp.]|nr:hypothetical protein [Lichenihabitans sp.]